MLYISMLLACCLKSAAAQTTAPILILETAEQYSAAGHITYLKDQNNELSIEDIIQLSANEKFIHAGEITPNFAPANYPYWFHVIVTNQNISTMQWLLEIQDPLIDHIDFYFVRDKKIEHITVGDHHPFHKRVIKVRNPAVPLNIAHNEVIDLYIRIQTSGSISLPMAIWLPNAFPAHAVNQRMQYGLYFGIIIALLLYNLMLYFSIRDTNYLYYFLFISAYAAAQFSYNGLSYTYFWPNHGQANLIAIFALTNCYTIFMLQFTRSFLSVRKFFPRLNKVMLFMMGVCVVQFLLFLVIKNKSISISVNALIVSLASVLVFIAGAYGFYKGVREARFFLLAWLVLLIGLFVFHFMILGIVPANSITIHIPQVGSALEAILLSFALADRMRLLKEENDRIQATAKEVLEARVKERTQELDAAMQSLAAANIKLQESSYFDGLTEVRNRKYLDDQYQKEWMRSRREGRSIALLMLDIDHFKSVNDEYGHLAGDKVLHHFAEVIQKVINRPGDVVARYGGEEFAVILPNTTIAGAWVLAEKIRAELENRPVIVDGKTIAITTSIGCAAQEPNHDDDNALWLIEMADKALYNAKAAGRNQVHTAITNDL